MSAPLKYREEIDGLRAIAVIAVILFHLNPHGLTGGFLGVDVFFVISGFLITTIIHRQLKRGTFSLADFWVRRIRRIYPALLVVVAASAAFGSVILISPQRQDMITQSLAAVGSFSNVLMWRTTGDYWSTNAENIPLLHTWSLSLEEQFYVVFPLLLVAVHAFSRRLIFPVVALVAACSVVLCVWGTIYYKVATFYLLPTRMWELMIGAMLAIRGVPRTGDVPMRGSSVFTLVGLAMIGVSFATIQDNANFPSVQPLLPCLGAALVIYFGRAPGLARRFLTLAPITYIGRISYSLYLWHWPVIAYSKYVTVSPDPLALVALTAVPAVLSYHFVECPFRRGFRGARAGVVVLPALVAGCLALLVAIPTSPLMPKEMAPLEHPDSLAKAWAFEATEAVNAGNGGIVAGKEGARPDVMLIGSSHARLMSPPVAAWATRQNRFAVLTGTSSVGVTNVGRVAANVNKRRMTAIERFRPEVTLVVDAWDLLMDENFETELPRVLERVSRASGHVFVFSQIPAVDLPLAYRDALRKYLVANAIWSQGLPPILPDPQVMEANAVVRQIVEAMALPNVQFVDLHDYLVTEEGTIRIFHEGRFMYSDYHHLNEYGAHHVFDNLIRPLLDAHVKSPVLPDLPALTHTAGPRRAEAKPAAAITAEPEAAVALPGVVNPVPRNTAYIAR